MKTWEKPTLIILTRSSAEAVLSSCKGYSEISAAAIDGVPSSYYDSCMLQPSLESACAFCQQASAS